MFNDVFSFSCNVTNEMFCTVCLFVCSTGPETYPCFLHISVYSFAPLGIAANGFKSWRLLLNLLSSSLKQSHAATTQLHKRSKIQQRIVLLRFLSSKWFGLIVFAVLITLHSAIYVVDITLITFGSACSYSGWASFWVLFQVIFPSLLYLSLYVCCTIVMLCGKISDTWSIRLEIIIVPLYWCPLVAVFAIGWWFSDVWPEHYFPVVALIWFGAMLDLIICMFIPAVRTFFVRNQAAEIMEFKNVESKAEQSKRMQVDRSVLLSTLSDDKLREAFLRFTTASLCPEIMLFWMDVKLRFETCNEPAERQKIALHILHEYLSNNAVFDLNIELEEKEELIRQLNDSVRLNSFIPNDFFNEVIGRVELDLIDCLSRFALTREFAANTVDLSSQQRAKRISGLSNKILMCLK